MPEGTAIDDLFEETRALWTEERERRLLRVKLPEEPEYEKEVIFA